jgi:hypothetical protein
MKNVNHTIGDVFREVGAAATHIGRYFMRTLSRMSWPALLASCFMLAVMLTILPLALTLFAIFLLAKIVMALVAGYQDNKRRGDYTPHKDV